MFGLDEHIASLSNGTTLALVVGVAIVLGLRHAGDPDHLTAVSTLVASGQEHAARSAARLGLAWGAGHATSLFVFGLPVVLYRAYLPAAVQAGAETAVGIVIVVLAVMLLARWRRGLFADDAHAHAHRKARTARGAYAIGLVHGAGGTAGVGVLLLASIKSSPLAIGALALFAACTAVSMALLSTGVGAALGAPAVRRSFARVAPVIGASSLAFGVWYALGAQGVVPYAF
jgi:cytochrome c biogenesis protein CcdA